MEFCYKISEFVGKHSMEQWDDLSTILPPIQAPIHPRPAQALYSMELRSLRLKAFRSSHSKAFGDLQKPYE